VNKRYDYKDQEFNLKMRIKFLEKKLREPDHDVEKYQEWESNLEIVREELTNLQLKKFKFFLSKWIHNFKTGSQTVNVIDCMFVSMEEGEQKEMAVKWYHRVVKEKDIRHYQLLAQYTREENIMLKNREKKGLKAQGEQYKKRLKLLKVENKKAIKNSREALSKNYDKLLRQHVLQLNHYKNKHDENQNILEDMKERIHILEREKYDLQEKLKTIDAMQEEIDKRAEVYKEGLIKSGLKNILQKEDS
tara:strand:+ start:1570 stop:2310 length:741 start_codon:yes stop_codon:yes gene_type:complete